MERYTHKDAEKAFLDLCDTLGKRVANSYKEVGAWRLDHNPTYGGCVIEEMCNEHGGITHPLGSMRMTPREFCQACRFAQMAISIEKDATTRRMNEAEG